MEGKISVTNNETHDDDRLCYRSNSGCKFESFVIRADDSFA